MSKRRAAAEMESPGVVPQEATLAPWMKWLLSAWLAVHVTAVFVAPFAFASNSGPAPSPFADAAYQLLRPYIGAMYLDHGYFFFAPNPGPSHLVDYKVEFDDGRPPVTGRFPDLKTERPRLLYHRHFMLAEALNNRFVPPEPPPEPSPPPLTATGGEKAVYQAARRNHERQVAMWRHARRQYEAMRKSFEEHLKDEYGGQRVTLTRVEHALPTPDEVELGGRKLNDPDTYRELPETINTGGER
jgi:hypothetical protein